MRLITENPSCKIDENTLMKDNTGKEKLVKLSDDPNIEKLLLGNPSDLVLSIGALKTIVANFAPHMAEEWILPMKTVKIQDKLVFIIDSPLIKASNFSIVEKAQMATRKTVKNTLTKPWLSSNSNEKTPKIPSKVDQTFTPERKLFNMGEDDDLFDTTLDTSSLENFGNQVDGSDDIIGKKNYFYFFVYHTECSKIRKKFQKSREKSHFPKAKSVLFHFRAPTFVYGFFQII